MERLGPSPAQLQKGGTLTPLVLQQASAGAAMALKFIHEQFGLAHSEVKPGNIVLANPQTTRVKLIDYDCAVFLDDSQQRETRQPGTYFYYSPKAKASQGYRPILNDVFAFGATFEELANSVASSELEDFLQKILPLLQPEQMRGTLREFLNLPSCRMLASF